MLNDIREHIHSNDQLQEEIEARSAPFISATYTKNRSAFARYIPHLNQELDAIRSENVSIFCNKNEQYNIVDFGLGRTLYGENPEQEIENQYSLWSQYSAQVFFDEAPAQPSSEEAVETKGLSFFQRAENQVEKQSTNADVLVILGLGLGRHVQPLLQAVKEKGAKIKHLIIYEPEAQYFKSACMVHDWESLLRYLDTQNIAVYVQVGKDGTSLVSDLKELVQHVNSAQNSSLISSALVYQHYYRSSFDAVLSALRHKTWAQLTSDVAPFSQKRKYTQYTPPWVEANPISALKVVEEGNAQFLKNLAAFEQYYPNIYAEFKDYQIDTWEVVCDANDSINMFNRYNAATWYGPEPKTEGEKHYKSFEKHPNRDGLILGYNGQKLKHYLHYRLVKRTESLLEHAEDEVNILPETIKSLILFGLGAGYELESLLAHREVEKLFICEPNRDFFYASLYSIDWHGILSHLDESGANVYINIGDDGSNLFRDLLGQFYNIGPYVLSQTYFYQGYFNASLNSAIAQLREQLQIVVSMGEYFDHACFAIEHTKEGMRREIPFLKAMPNQYLSATNKELPILFVGNGPSLDYSIDTIRELKEQAIVISCGTSLQVLHRNGIVPDFHAEIELNRATYDWACRVGDPAYLKQITLLSCNGIHPDTCDLYKDVLIAFKEGESATVSALNVIGEDTAECLSFAFPTVSNFAVNLFLKLGFHQFYLFGIDMGFVDSSQHHSSQSGYYSAQGKELYKYDEANNTGLVVPGNFRTVVNTKHEFKLAKTIIEQALASSKVDCYNTSDGALIAGASPLDINNILLMSNAQDKQQALLNMRQCFEQLPSNEFVEGFDSKYQHQKLMDELSYIISMLGEKRDDDAFKDQDDIFKLVEKQKQFLFYSYRQGDSLFFYYLYGSMNYINSVLSKAAMHHDKDIAITVAMKAIQFWKECLSEVQLLLNNKHQLFDTSSSFTLRRERILLAKDKMDVGFVSFDKRIGQMAETELNMLEAIYPSTISTDVYRSESQNIDAFQRDSIILMLQSSTEWPMITPCLALIEQANTGNVHKKNVLICIACSYQSEHIQEQEAYQSKYPSINVSFQVLPSLAQNWCLDKTFTERYKAGSEPCAPLALHLESALKHVQNAAKHFIFIEKLDFSESGSKPAYAEECSESADNELSDKKSSHSLNLSDSVVASEFVDKTVLSGLQSLFTQQNFHFYDYKTYAAIPRAFCEPGESATLLDLAGSRGLKVNRPFTAVDFLLRWQKPALVEKNIIEFMKAG